MIILTWSNYCNGNHEFCKTLSETHKYKEISVIPGFSKNNLKQIKKMAETIANAIGLEFAHNLKRGWENKLLLLGRISSESGKRLKTSEEISEAMSRDGQIHFTAYGKNKSLSVVEKLKKPANLCWG